MVDKIETFEEFKRERFKDLPITHDRVMTAQTPRFFRFGGTSNGEPLEQMFTSLVSLDIDQLNAADIKDYLLQALGNMTPDQAKSAIDQLASVAAEHHLKRLVSMARV